MNKTTYIGMLDGQNEIEVYEFDRSWEECWDGMFDEGDGYKMEDDNVFCLGKSEKEVEKKLKKFLVKEIMNS